MRTRKMRRINLVVVFAVTVAMVLSLVLTSFAFGGVSTASANSSTNSEISVTSSSNSEVGEVAAPTSNSKINKVLFFVNSEEDYNAIFDWLDEGVDIDDNLFEVRLSGVNKVDLTSYLAIAMPYTADAGNQRLRTDNSVMQNAFQNNTHIYLYGALTINDYKNAVGLQSYSLDVNVNGASDNSITQVKQFFEIEYEQEEVFNVIGYNDNALLCKISDESIAAFVYLFNVVQNFELLTASTRNTTNTTIIKSEFNFTSSWTFGPTVCTVHMDYTLYQNFNEQDPVYDYFGIATKVWVTRSNPSAEHIWEVNTIYDLPIASSELLETGPGNQSNAGNLNVSIGFGMTGPTGSIGYSVNLSDTRPTIRRVENYALDIVEWTMTRRTIAPINLGSTPLNCVASWARQAVLRR